MYLRIDKDNAMTDYYESWFLNELVNNIETVVYFKDLEFKYRFVNDTFCRKCKVEREQILGQTDEVLFDRKLFEVIDRTDREVLETQKPVRYESEDSFSDTKMWVLTEKFPVFNLEGQLIGIKGYTRDATPKVSAELTLKDYEKRFQVAFESSSIGKALISASGDWMKINQALCKLSGYTEPELMSKTLNELTYADDYGIDDQLIHELKSGELSSYNITKRFLKKDGSVFWANLYVSIIRDPGNQTHYFITELEDITGRIAMVKELQAKTKELDVFFTTALDLFCVTDPKGIFKRISKQWEPATGFHESELLNRGMASFIHKEDSARAEDCLKSLDEGNDTAVFVSRFAKKDGTFIWLEWKTRKNQDVLIHAARDISSRIKVEKELTAAKDKAEESEKLKTAFLANMSHEFRTPLNSIVGFSKLLINPDLDHFTRAEYVSLLNKGSDRLISLVENMIDVSTIEAGQMHVRNQRFYLNSVLLNLYFAYVPKIDAENVSLSFEFALHDEESIVNTDEQILRKIFIQLLDNAVKFTEKGNINFGYEVSDDGFNFFVSDTGVGMRQEAIGKMFLRFNQEDNSISRPYDGAGLGLTIVDGLIKLFNGYIEIKSEKHSGTNITFHLPIDRDNDGYHEEPTKIAFTSENKPSKRVLVVDDNQDNVTLIKYITRKELDFEFIWAESGYAAIDTLRQTTDFACILLDIKMPGIDGFETLTRVREIAPKIPAIAVTAYASNADRDKAISMGFNDYISKPIDAGELLMLLRTFI